MQIHSSQRWPARVPVLFLILAAGLMGVFAKVAVKMRNGETGAFDSYFLNIFRGAADPSHPIGPTWLAEAARDFTSLGSYVILGTIVCLVVLYLVSSRRRLEAFQLAIGVVSGTVLSNLLKIGFNRPRPTLDNAPVVFTSLSQWARHDVGCRLFDTGGHSSAARAERTSANALPRRRGSGHGSRRTKPSVPGGPLSNRCHRGLVPRECLGNRLRARCAVVAGA